MAEWLPAGGGSAYGGKAVIVLGRANNMACTYVLFSESTNKFYVGSSRGDDAEVRLKAHNGGKTQSTKNGRPWISVHLESFVTYTEARKRENFLKSGAGRNWLKQELGHYKKVV
jgi:putative endonuclease